MRRRTVNSTLCHTGVLQSAVLCFKLKCTWKLMVWRSEGSEAGEEEEDEERDKETERERDVGGQPARCDRGRRTAGCTAGCFIVPRVSGQQRQACRRPWGNHSPQTNEV